MPLSGKLERVPKNYTIVDQRVSITLSTRLLGGEGWGEGGALCDKRYGYSAMPVPQVSP